MAQSFDDFYAAKRERALGQSADSDGKPPVVVVTRHSLSFGAVGIPVFGNYHSRLSDIAHGRQILSEWLKKNGYDPTCAIEDLPVIWGRWAPDGPQRILDWTVIVGNTPSAPVATREAAETIITARLEALGIVPPPVVQPGP